MDKEILGLLQDMQDNINKRFDTIEAGQEELKASQKEITSRLDTLEKGQKEIISRLDELSKEVEIIKLFCWWAWNEYKIPKENQVI